MYVFIDTEFTDFIDTHMMSIGLVSIDGHEMYRERLDVPMQSASAFVKEHIIPLLYKNQDEIMTQKQIADDVYRWLDALPSDKVQIVIDYYADWELLIDLLDGILPPNVVGQPVFIQTICHPFNKDLNLGFEHYFSQHPEEKQHHALSDAKANKEGWVFAVRARAAKDAEGTKE